MLETVADSRDAIRESDANATGNVIRDNTAHNNKGFTLNSTTNVSGNITIS